MRDPTTEHYGDHHDHGGPGHELTADNGFTSHHPPRHEHHRDDPHLDPRNDHHQAMSALATLLDLQGHDVSLDQLRHRRASLPERAELAGLAKRDVALDTAMAADGATLAAVMGEQKRLEDEVARIVADRKSVV